MFCIPVIDSQDTVHEGENEFNRVECAQCRAVVGRVYNKTSPEDAKLRDLIALDRGRVCSYTFGRHAVRVSGQPEDDPNFGAAGESAERVSRLEEQMVKVENVLVLFNERMGAMESALRNVLARLDAATARSEPATWGAGPGVWSGRGAYGGDGEGFGGVCMPALPRESDGGGDGGARR